MLIRKLCPDEIAPEFFAGFNRAQHVTGYCRITNGRWQTTLRECDESWDTAYLNHVIDDMRGIALDGGAVFAALEADRVMGFTAVCRPPMGSCGQYRQLAKLYVHAASRGNGLGKKLFLQACDSARKMGAEKLYISAHSSIETIGWYRHMGCTEAAEYDQALAALEPDDVQMEYTL